MANGRQGQTITLEVIFPPSYTGKVGTLRKKIIKTSDNSMISDWSTIGITETADCPGSYKVQYVVPAFDTQVIWDPQDASLDRLSEVIVIDLGVAGPGNIEFTYTVTRSDTGAPIGDVEVWVTMDIGGTNIVAAGRTDDFGIMQPKPMLNEGTYYFWRKKSGFSFVNPDTEVVSNA